jgi:hypothetical protein
MPATFRIVLNTQVHENYGAHCWDGSGECPQSWKAKGGSEYHLSVGDVADVQALGSDGLETLAGKLASQVERHDDSWQEYSLGWELLSDADESYDEKMYREHGCSQPVQVSLAS